MAYRQYTEGFWTVSLLGICMSDRGEVIELNVLEIVIYM